MHDFRVGKVHSLATDGGKEVIVWNTKLLMRGLFSRRKILPRVIRAHSISQGLSLKPILLIAHGTVRNGRWYFSDSRKRVSLIQRWIDKHDGKTGALLLFSCNPSNLEVRSRFSLVVHLNRVASLLDLFRGGCVRLYHPQLGYIEDNYYRLHSIIRS